MEKNIVNMKNIFDPCLGGKMKKVFLGVMFFLFLGLGSAIFIIYYSEDREPPIIQLPKMEITYVENDSYDKLLENVTAYDEHDGDVSDSLEVENVYPNISLGTATIIYAAKDSNNNVSKQKYEVTYVQQDDEGLSSKSESGSSPDVKVEKETEDETEIEKKKETEKKKEKESASKENPVITLTCESIEIDAGDDMNRLSLIKSVSDDRDTEEYLWKRIQITGDEFDRDTPGTYKQIFFVIDSDGNKSNQAELIITVQ